MRGSGPGIRRLCIAVSASQGDPDGLVTGPLLAGLCSVIGLDRIQWEPRPTGIALGVVPPGVDEPAVLADLVLGLRTVLSRRNESLSRRNESPGQERLRLTAAAHEGITYLGEPGFIGPVVNAVCQACAHPGLALLLSRRPSDDLVVALPSHLGEDLLPSAARPAELFRTCSATWIEFQ
jgi:hypothetical protein